MYVYNIKAQSFFLNTRYTKHHLSLNNRTGQLIVDLQINVLNKNGAYSTKHLMNLFMGTILKELRISSIPIDSHHGLNCNHCFTKRFGELSDKSI